MPLFVSLFPYDCDQSVTFMCTAVHKLLFCLHYTGIEGLQCPAKGRQRVAFLCFIFVFFFLQFSFTTQVFLCVILFPLPCFIPFSCFLFIIERVSFASSSWSSHLHPQHYCSHHHLVLCFLFHHCCLFCQLLLHSSPHLLLLISTFLSFFFSCLFSLGFFLFGCFCFFVFVLVSLLFLVLISPLFLSSSVAGGAEKLLPCFAVYSRLKEAGLP